MRMYEALPAYLGGKRRLVGRVMKYLPSPQQAPTFADAFLGGGSVSLYAKARGYAVRCNDIAERSVIVGRALVENDRVTLSEADLLRLFVPHPDAGTFLRDRLAPDVVTPTHAAFLDNAMAVARSTPGVKGNLLLLLCVKYLLDQRPMGNFGAKTIVHQMAEGDFDGVNPAYLKDAVARMVLAHPLAVCRKIARKVNGGVFATERSHEASQADARDFVSGTQADILFLDSPYAGTTSYEVALRPLDEMLAGHAIDPESSRFSKADSLDALSELFERARHIPVWAMTYGGPAIDARMLEERMGRYRRQVRVESVRYAHLAALASDEAKARNLELILIGKE
jgi:hypothetical protein